MHQNFMFFVVMIIASSINSSFVSGLFSHSVLFFVFVLLSCHAAANLYDQPSPAVKKLVTGDQPHHPLLTLGLKMNWRAFKIKTGKQTAFRIRLFFALIELLLYCPSCQSFPNSKISRFLKIYQAKWEKTCTLHFCIDRTKDPMTRGRCPSSGS